MPLHLCSAASLQYLSLFDAAGQLSHQPDAALWILAKMYGAAGGCAALRLRADQVPVDMVACVRVEVGGVRIVC